MMEEEALENMRKTAFHEAGHVFLHEVFEIPYKSVQINENAQIGEQEGVVHGDGETTVDDLIYACICFSGAVAEDKYFYPPDWWIEALALGSSFTMGAGFEDFLKYNALGLSEHQKKLSRSITKKIIIENWSIIEKIANAIFEKKKLSSEEIKLILGEWGLKEKKYCYTSDLVTGQVISDEALKLLIRKTS